jgi:hypothetical protein
MERLLKDLKEAILEEAFLAQRLPRIAAKHRRASVTVDRLLQWGTVDDIGRRAPVAAFLSIAVLHAELLLSDHELGAPFALVAASLWGAWARWSVYRPQRR